MKQLWYKYNVIIEVEIMVLQFKKKNIKFLYDVPQEQWFKKIDSTLHHWR